MWPRLRQTGELGAPGNVPHARCGQACPLQPDTQGTNRHPAMVLAVPHISPHSASQSCLPSCFSGLQTESVLELVPAAQGERSEAQVGDCVTICILTGLLGALEGGELQTPLQPVRSNPRRRRSIYVLPNPLLISEEVKILHLSLESFPLDKASPHHTSADFLITPEKVTPIAQNRKQRPSEATRLAQSQA